MIRAGGGAALDLNRSSAALRISASEPENLSIWVGGLAGIEILYTSKFSHLEVQTIS